MGGQKIKKKKHENKQKEPTVDETTQEDKIFESTRFFIILTGSIGITLIIAYLVGV